LSELKQSNTGDVSEETSPGEESPSPKHFKIAFKYFPGLQRTLQPGKKDNGEGMSQSSIKSLPSQRTGLGTFIYSIEELRSSKLPISTQDYQMAGLKQAKRRIFFPTPIKL